MSKAISMRKIVRQIFFLAFFHIASLQLYSQSYSVEGIVTDSITGLPIELVSVYSEKYAKVAETDSKGRYNLQLSEKGRVLLKFSRLGYAEKSIEVTLNQNKIQLDIALQSLESDINVTVTESRLQRYEMVRENMDAIKLIPSTTGNLESALPHIALGARSGTGGELSSQYNVRGGNYDENLVYVNDFEIFRPQLIRSGQQEGLSFPNIDLMRDLSFSSGGYESKYGDKMASVLDIRYKRPTVFKGSLSGSLLGGSAHLEGSKKLGRSEFNQLRYLIGARYKTTRYLLGSLDVSGEYLPDFADIQGYLTYDFHRNWQIGVMTNYNLSEYDFTPRTRATALGLIDLALELSSVFEGAEADRFKTGMIGTSLTFLPERERNPLFLKLLASTYRGVEQENIDITGYYRLSQVETDVNSDNQGEEIALLGIGVEQNYSRNRLFNSISNIQLKGGIEFQSVINKGLTNFLQFGLKYQRESFDDRLNEWIRIDSAGYSLPYTGYQVSLFNVLKSENLIESNKFTGFIQNTYKNFKEGKSELSLTVGTRLSYWDLGGAFNLSPRAQLLYRPLKRGKGITYKLAGGVYYQTPFYRELRRMDGTINTELKPQRSLHFLAGMTKDFQWATMSERPFKFIMEAYYKSFSDLVSYDIDNVRLRYSGENDASGYAMGLDMRLNGEFVPGAESWINLSFLSTRESLEGVQHRKYSEGQIVEVNDVPRPTNQAFNVSIYFQDYLPKNENIRVFLNMTFGSGLPFGLPENNTEFRNIFTFRPYRRVDMGFGLQLWKKDWINKKPNHLLRSFDNAWLNLEVFNMMGIENVSSNTWVRTVFSQQYAVPNNLTNRRINLRFRIDF